ncbi:hypothetical protein [Lederbergia citrea]|uniref:DOD-type homing endonuclease domain-containing protein n=1 Tax=Lederbergia citrea TaxID=2833581 RepID=A0A942Z3Z3_9BACI|nr:hypothetical protein [Lederbergia citrea]MBS4221865.1 hypothetical protein [Lederbergia citrea]
MIIKWTRELVEGEMDDCYTLLEIIRGAKATHLVINCSEEKHPPIKISTRTFSKRIKKSEELCNQCAGRRNHNFGDTMPMKKLYSLYVVKDMSSAQIALLLGEGVTRQHINHLLRKYGIPRKQQHRNREKPLQKKVSKDDLYYLYIIERKSQTEIAKKYNVDSGSISYLMRVYGIKARVRSEAGKLRSLRDSKVNTSFFETLSADFFYVLGVLLSDGWRSGNAIGLQMADMDVLEYVAKVIGYTGKISTRKPRSGGKINGKDIHGRKKMYVIQFQNYKIAQIMNKWGLVERKSKSLTLPKIPKEFMGDFLRGVLDGDGSVIIQQQSNSTGIYKTKQFRLVFYTASINFRDALCEYLRDKYDITGGSGFEEKTGKYYLSIGNKDSVYLLCGLLFNQNDPFGMQRKKEKISYIFEYQKNDKIPKYKRLTKDEVHLITSLLSKRVPVVTIASRIGCSNSAIYSIKIGRTHRV